MVGTFKVRGKVLLYNLENIELFAAHDQWYGAGGCRAVDRGAERLLAILRVRIASPIVGFVGSASPGIGCRAYIVGRVADILRSGRPALAFARVRLRFGLIFWAVGRHSFLRLLGSH